MRRRGQRICIFLAKPQAGDGRHKRHDDRRNKRFKRTPLIAPPLVGAE
jgi:hypothetical protein